MKALFKSPAVAGLLLISVFFLSLCPRTIFAAQDAANLPAGTPPVRMMMTDPGPIGVNPQITIMALATRTGRWLLDNEARFFA